MGKFLSDPIHRTFKEGKETIIEIQEDFPYELQPGEIITTPKGFLSDGASIPKPFWIIVGHPLECDNLKAALIHDFMCKTGQELKEQGIKYTYTWQQTHEIFRQALIDCGVPVWKAGIMHKAVFTNWLLNKKLKW
jgi:hypothetical protein